MSTHRLFGGTIRSALIHAATSLDRKNATRRGYNEYALAQYLGRIDEAVEAIDAGAAPRAALLKAFNDRLLDCLLIAIGEPKFTQEEREALEP